jgi:hypothetical protein
VGREQDVSKKIKKSVVINHWIGKPMGEKFLDLLLEARAARLGAREMARSGHPGRRAEGKQGVLETTAFIQQIYVQDAREQMS